MNQCNCKNTDELRIVRGNAFGVQINIEARKLDGTLVEDFDLSQADATLKVIHYDQKAEMSFVVAGNSAIIGFDNTLSLGWYGFEMYGTFNDSPWRWCVQNVFQIVETNEKANIPTWTFLTDDTYVMDGSLTLMSGEVYQSDWDETNIYSPAYIKNKPDVVLHPEFNQTVERIDHDIDAEELARQQSDQTLQGNIDAEETRAKTAEKQNADDIDAEELARQQADTTLQNNIDNEATARENADTTLQGHIDDEEARAKAAEQQNADDIDALENRMGTAEDDIDALEGRMNTAEDDIDTIESKIPAAASDQNKLVDQQQMNSSISTATATYRGAYNEVSDLSLTVAATHAQIEAALATKMAALSITPDNNDYAFVQIPTADATPTEIARVERYKYNGTAWAFEYALNNSGFTADQWAALNSGITSGLVTKLRDLPTNAELTTLLNGLSGDISDEATARQNADTTLQGNIDAEALARGNSDTTLQGHIDDEETRAKAAEKQNADDIDALENRMGTAEDDIDALEGRMNTAEDDIDTIESKIPAAASDQNKLVDKQQMDNATANFITKSVNDLVNYYLRSDTYTKAEVQQLIAAVKQFTYEVVSTLPTASASTMNKIYLVPSADPQTQNVKDEFITIATETEEGGETITTYSWEQIGSTAVDLSGYYTSQQTDTAISTAISTALADYSTTTQMNTAITNALNTALADYSTTTEMTAAIATAIANYYTKAEVDALIANFITKSVNDLVNYYLKSDTYTKTEVQQLIAAVKQFTYEVVSTLPTASASTMNKIYLVPSADPQTQNVKDEYITIATETEEGGETVTTYSWELIGSTAVDLSGYYTSQQTDTAISTAISTALADYSTTTQMNTAITNALNTALADYSTTSQMNTAISTALASYYTKTEVDTALSGKQNTLTFDNVPTENSSNPVKSGGVYSALAGKQASITDGAQIGLGCGVCTTASATAAKEITIANFLLLKNVPVSIRFQYGISINGSTLNISSTGAKPILIDGIGLPAGVIKPNTTATMFYDGTNWNVTALTTGISANDELLVDLGLPSGLLWATRNLDVTQANGFAASPYQYECSFVSWGNTDGHNPISASSFGEWSFGNANTSEPYASSPGAALTASFGNGYDAACVNLGKPWRMPTTEEFAELFNASNTKFINADGTDIDSAQVNKLTTVNGVVGIMLKSLVNGKTLFFPCAGYGHGSGLNFRGSVGYYWSSSLSSAAFGRSLYFYSGGVSPQSYSYRFSGLAVRPVQ